MQGLFCYLYHASHCRCGQSNKINKLMLLPGASQLTHAEVPAGSGRPIPTPATLCFAGDAGEEAVADGPERMLPQMS